MLGILAEYQRNIMGGKAAGMNLEVRCSRWV